MIRSRNFIGEIILNYENALNFDYDTEDAKNNMAMGIDFCSNAPETAGRQQ